MSTILMPLLVVPLAAPHATAMQARCAMQSDLERLVHAAEKLTGNLAIAAPSTDMRQIVAGTHSTRALNR